MLEVQAVKQSDSSASAPALVILAGALVFVSYYDAQNNIVNTIGRVLSVGTLDTEGMTENGLPSLTIAVPKSDADPKILAGPNWYDAFLRITGVRHVSHGSFAKGGIVAAWQELDAPEEAFPALLDVIDAPPENPVYTRHGMDVVAPPVSIEQAAAAQSGTAPQSSTVSPLINEPVAPAVPAAPTEPPAAPVTTETGQTILTAPAAPTEPPAAETTPAQSS